MALPHEKQRMEAWSRAKECAHVFSDGRKCRGKAVKGTEFCANHTVGKTWNRRRGGRRQLDITENLAHLKVFIHNMIKECKSGKIAPNQLNSIISAANTIVKIHEIEEVQKVLVEMNGEVLRARLREKLPEGADYIYQQGNVNPVDYEPAVLDLEPVRKN